MQGYQIILLIIYIASMILVFDLTKAIAGVEYFHFKKKQKIPQRSKNPEFEKTMRKQFFSKVWSLSTIMLMLIPLINTVWYFFLFVSALFRAAEFSNKPLLIDVITQSKSIHSFVLKKWERPKWMRVKFREYLSERDKIHLTLKKKADENSVK